MPGTRAKGKQTPAQRAAAERNLRKGNPRAFSKPATSEVTESDLDRFLAAQAAAGKKPPAKRTYRAKAASGVPPRPAQRRKKPAAVKKPAAPSPPPPPASPPATPRRAHPLDDVLGAVFG